MARTFCKNPEFVSVSKIKSVLSGDKLLIDERLNPVFSNSILRLVCHLRIERDAFSFYMNRFTTRDFFLQPAELYPFLTVCTDFLYFNGFYVHKHFYIYSRLTLFNPLESTEFTRRVLEMFPNIYRALILEKSTPVFSHCYQCNLAKI